MEEEASEEGLLDDGMRVSNPKLGHGGGIEVEPFKVERERQQEEERRDGDELKHVEVVQLLTLQGGGEGGGVLPTRLRRCGKDK